MLALAITAAIVPALLLLWYFHSRDIYPEPPRVVWATFFLGVLSIPGVLIVAVPAGRLLVGIANPYEFGFAEAFVCAAIPEELFKFLVLCLYAARHREFNEPMDGVIYGVAASLGFATLENILYVGSGGMGVAVLRALTAVPAHAFTGAVMGYYVGRARFATQARGGLFGLALVVPMLLHGTYDFPILIISRYKKVWPTAEVPGPAALLTVVTLVTLIYEWRLALRLVRRLRAEQDAGRVHAVTPLAPLDPVAPLAPPAGASPEKKSLSLLGWVQILTGGLLITAGGLMVVLLVIALLTGVSQQQVGGVVFGGAIIGVLPLLVGMVLYRAGIRRLNQAGSPAGNPVATVPKW